MPVTPQKTTEDMPCSVKLDSNLLKKVDDISAAEKRSRSGTVRIALIEYIKAYGRRRRKEDL